MTPPALTTRIPQQILSELTLREMRLLSLTVAVRRSLVPAPRFTCELSTVVQSALRKLVAEKKVKEQDGVFSILPAH